MIQHPDIDHGIILASKSPRRRYLLEQAGLKFSVIPSSFDESSVTMMEPESYVRKLAECKANVVAETYPDHWVIGADTIVLIGNDILGKPRSDDEARKMLRRLSAKTHRVLTGYCVCCKNRDRFYSETVSTDVCFKDLSDEEIEWYIQSGEPFDKAGSYAIQGLGTFLVKRINGSYTNVVGLPVCEIVEFLINAGVLVRSMQKK
ncbi:MAG: septum formation inhibitor Maf [Deltaproteobacteria bacterium]|jgi:septum formation protein|nr:septum formation inhibitor Maf [Deltaproteobacteria bacterium]